ncbi:hypothetical protein [Yokenella regensburgei]|uniref:hypothetical protein n=1 Tax=Yokenella regensburgei TaxID=158877 RepID=UPI001375634E|nr:hypothetical protein [Yokenella regensburgei]KAF1367490.1 hypothetical protein FHR25_003916 [Yokenella regensburgei]
MKKQKSNSTDIVSVDEVLVGMLAIFRAPGADEVEQQLNQIEKMALAPQDAASKRAEIDIRGIKWLGLTKSGWKAKEYDKAEIAVFILKLSGAYDSALSHDELKEKIKALMEAKDNAEGVNGKD